MEQNNKARCPVCGKFATQAMVQKYDALVSENKMLQTQLDNQRAMYERMEEERRSVSAQLAAETVKAKEAEAERDYYRKANTEKAERIGRLLSRPLWQRIINKH